MGRPTHARVIIEPPSELADLYAQEDAFDLVGRHGSNATIEIGRLRWKTLATDVPLGGSRTNAGILFSYSPRRRHTYLEPTVCGSVLQPNRLGKISDPNAMFSSIVLDLNADETPTNLLTMGATYNSGLIQIHTNKTADP